MDDEPGPPLRPGPAPAHRPQRAGRFLLVSAGREAGRWGTLASNLSLAPLDFEEFSGVVPGLAGRPLTVSGAVSASGPMDRLRVDTTLSDQSTGTVRANVLVDTSGPTRTFRGNVATERLDLAVPLANRDVASRLTAEATIDLALDGAGFAFDRLTGTAQVRSTGSRIWGYEWQSASSRVRFSRGVLGVDGRAAAYGATATARGTISPSARPVRYQLAGQLTNADLRRMPRQLPLPRLESDLAGTYDVKGRGHTARRVDGVRALHGGTHRHRPRQPRALFQRGGVTRYGFDGRVDHANVEHWGQVLEIEWLQRDAYASDLSGQLTVDGSGTSLATLVLDAKASLESSTAFNSSFERADVTAHIENQTLTTSARGTASNVNATVLAGMTTLDSGLNRGLRRDGRDCAPGSALYAGRRGRQRQPGFPGVLCRPGGDHQGTGRGAGRQ